MALVLKRDRIAQHDPKYKLEAAPPPPPRVLPVHTPKPEIEIASALKTLLDDNRAGQLALLRAIEQRQPSPAEADWEFNATYGPKGITSVECVKDGLVAGSFDVWRDKAGKVTQLTGNDCTFIVQRDSAGKLSKLTMKRK